MLKRLKQIIKYILLIILAPIKLIYMISIILPVIDYIARGEKSFIWKIIEEDDDRDCGGFGC